MYENGIYRDLTAEELAARQAAAEAAALWERSRPLTESELSRLFLQQNIQAVITDDATASRAVEFHPVLKQDASLVAAGTRINWKGTLKRAAVALWDTPENTPDNAPGLWEDIGYREGFRVIPETITPGTAFARGEYGWWGTDLYRSLLEANVYTPEAYPAGWEAV